MLSLIAATSGNDFLDYLSRASIITFLIVVIYGGYKKWWVFGWVLKESEQRNANLKEECDRERVETNAWRETALKGANIATQAFEQIGRFPSERR